MTDDFDPSKVSWVWDERGVERLAAVLEAEQEIVWDLETTGLNEFMENGKIVMASFTLGSNGDTWVLPLYHPESPLLGIWRRVFRRIALIMVKKALVGHNVKFDCRWTYHHVQVDLSHSTEWDTRISSHLLDETWTTRLKDRAMKEFGIENWADFDLSKDFAALSIPLIDLGLYAARDTYWTWRLLLVHRERMLPEDQPFDDDEIEDARLGRLAKWVAVPTVRTMTAVEQRGIRLDLDWVNERIREYEQIRIETNVFLSTRYGKDPEKSSFAPTSHWFRAWTEEAVAAGDLRIQAMTKGGNPQWSKSVLVRQARHDSEVAEQLLNHRAAVKRFEYLRSWRNFQRADGDIHANYNVGSLITGRLSSSDPNMQQVTKALRPAFIPRPGFVIADFDYSQIELRVAAFIARCIPMIEAFLRGDDLHRMIAARITNKTLTDVTDDERQGGKAGNFGFLFGQSAFGFKFYAENVYGLSFTDDECQRIYNAFFAEWVGMKEWHNKTILRAHRTGQVVSPIGRVRRLPGIYSANDGHVRHAENAALNAPVQGFASDLMQSAAALIEGTMPGSTAIEDVRIVGTVHDSLVAELPEDRWEETAMQVIDRMTNGVLHVLKRLDCEFDVPIVAEATIGTRWGLKDIGELAG